MIIGRVVNKPRTLTRVDIIAATMWSSAANRLPAMRWPARRLPVRRLLRPGLLSGVARAARVDELIGYREPWGRPWDFPGVGVRRSGRLHGSALPPLTGNCQRTGVSCHVHRQLRPPMSSALPPDVGRPHLRCVRWLAGVRD